MSAFISALIDMDEAKHFLVVVPSSLVRNWTLELEKWVPNINIFIYSGEISVAKRRANLQLAQRSTAVLICTYGLMTKADQLCLDARGNEFRWDYGIFDEAHNLKNASAKRTKEARKLVTYRRLLLTGTPIMNKLTDFYTLVSFMSQDEIFLGNMAEFKRRYQGPIERARTKDARLYEKQVGNKMAEDLRQHTERWILRRTKDEINNRKNNPSSNGTGNPEFPELGIKNDFVLWCKMTDTQLDIYNKFLTSEEVKDVLMTKRSPLVQCNVLKQICDHPRRLSARKCRALGLDIGLSESIIDRSGIGEAIDECAVNIIDRIDLDVILEESGKMRMLNKLVEMLDGTQFLVFSSSIKVLDMIEKLFIKKSKTQII